MYMDTTDRPELRLWKILWPVSILAGMAMLVRMMHHQLVQEQTLDSSSELWVDPRIALSVSIGVGLLASLLLISRVTPASCKRWTIIVAAVVVAALLALSFVPDFEVFTPVMTVLAVPVVRGLRLPVLVPRGRKLLTWSATLVSFVAIPIASVPFAVGDLKLFPGPLANLAFVTAVSATLATALAAALIGREWRTKPWRGVLLEFVVIQIMVSVAARVIVEATISP